MPRSLLVLGSVFLVVAASCGGGTEGVATTSTAVTGTTGASGSNFVQMTPPEAEPATAWEQAIAGLDDEIPLQTAIDAFSVAFGPIDGATPTDRPAGYSGSGSGPLRWILGHWDELTSTQRAQVQSVIDSWESGSGLGNDAVLAAHRSAPAANALGQQVSQALVDDVVVSLEVLLGRTLDIPITVKIASNQAQVGDNWGVALARDGNGGFTGPAATCSIVFASKAVDLGATESVALAAHETFHCFQAALGTLDAANKRPAWIVEGMAEWVGEAVSGGSSLSEDTWGGWLDAHAYAPLFARAYSAIGFYAHVDDNGVELWDRLDPALAASDTSSEAAYSVLIDSTGTEMVDSWAAGYYRDPNEAPLWDQDGPGITFDAPFIDQEDLGNEMAVGLGAAPYAAFFGDLDVSAEVVTFESPGPGLALLADGTTRRLAELHGTALCTTGACMCPEGTPGYGTVFADTLPGVFSVAPTGDVSGSDVIVVGWSLERFCNGERCQVGTWSSVKWDVYRILGGGYGIPLSITRDGEGYVDWGEATPLYGWTYGGTLTTGLQPVPIKIELDGAGHFEGEYTGTVFTVTASNGSFSLTPYIDLGDGWMPTAPSTTLGPYGNLGPTATFACSGDTLVLNGAVEFTRLSKEASIPGEANDLTPTTGSGDTGQPGAIPEVDPCTLLSLEEVQSLDPDATQPDGPDDLTTTFLTQCTFLPSLSIQVYGATGPGTFTQDSEDFGLTVVEIPGVGDWAIALVSPAEPQYDLDESVALVVAGSAAGTVALVPFETVTPGTPGFDRLVQLLELALSRL